MDRKLGVVTMTSHISIKSNDSLKNIPARIAGCAKIRRKRVLLVSSSGGHWVQMNRIKEAFEEKDLYFACTERDYSQAVPKGHFYYVPDASKASSVALILWQALSVLFLILRVRPDVVVTTGAAPGYFAILFAKKLGAKTVWIDSIANVDRVSLSGAKAAKYADLFLTQWEHLARDTGPLFFGSVL